MEACVTQLRAFGVEPHVEVIAHRSPDRVAEFAGGAEQGGFGVIIAAAGMSNALAGAVAAHTPPPVIAVPLGGGTLHGFDALLSAVQMPPGMPVATVSVGAAGTTNAALLAVQILARTDRKARGRLSQVQERSGGRRGQEESGFARKDCDQAGEVVRQQRPTSPLAPSLARGLPQNLTPSLSLGKG